MTIFDDIRKDREVGTHGDLETITDHDWSLDTEGENTYYVIGTGPAYPLAVIAVESAWGFEAQIDADTNRFCRVPKLEAIALAAEKLADSIEKDWQEASYREFQEMKGYLKEFREACK